MAFPSFTWDRQARRYRDAGGRFVSLRDVRQALDVAIRGLRREMRSVTQRYQRGEISLGEWRVAMQSSVKNTHLFSAALAKGGWGQMTPADFGRVGGIVRVQYQYLERFAVGVADGKIPTDGRMIRRAEMYFETGRGTYHKVQRDVMSEGGFDQERSVLHPADHCDECVDEAAKGWQPVGSIIPIGERTCLGNCHCTMEYRSSTPIELVA